MWPVDALRQLWADEPVGLIALLLGFASLTWNVVQWLLDQRLKDSTLFRVTTQFGLLPQPLGVDVLMVQVYNHSRHEAQIRGFGVSLEGSGPFWRLVPRRRRIHMTLVPSELARTLKQAPPKTIPPKQTDSLFHEMRYLAPDLLEGTSSHKVRIRGWVLAGDGRTHDGTPLVIDRSVIKRVLDDTR